MKETEGEPSYRPKQSGFKVAELVNKMAILRLTHKREQWPCVELFKGKNCYGNQSKRQLLRGKNWFDSMTKTLRVFLLTVKRK